MKHQYYVNIRVDRASSLFIHFFLGAVSPDPATWSFAHNLVGSHSVLSLSTPSSPTTPAPISYGQIPLTHALMPLVSSGIIPNLKPEHVVPLLKKQLSWRVQGFDDKPLTTRDIKGLKVFVVGQEVTQAERADQFPGYGELVVYGDVTRGMIGGLAEGEEA